MHPIITKTFGGLSTQYYIRHFLFGLLFPALFIAMQTQMPEGQPVNYGLYVVLVINTLLYPYARFVYESIVSFIMGDNVFFVNAIMLLMTKLFTMLLCWGFALFIAPVGLLYLYVYHSRQQKKLVQVD